MIRRLFLSPLLVILIFATASAARSSEAAEAGPTALNAADLQILLDRAGFSCGVIDGQPGSNTRKALAAFQEAYDLEVTGSPDALTLQNLQAASGGEPWLEYVLTPEDLAGPFVPNLPADLEEQAKLPALGYTSPLEMLSERFHSTPDLLRASNPEARFAAAGEKIRVPNVVRPALEAPGEAQDVRIVVSQEDSTLTVERGTDVLFFAPVSAGSRHDPLPLGEWKVKGVARNPDFHYNPALFWDADPSHSKATIKPGPNNPAGVVWVDITRDHYGIHGTPSPEKVGKTESHGCVRLTNWDAMTVAGLVKPGTPVLFR
jgi:lipoprotein-anchoring transpeptidase ErfK/SrfK